jgi:hypothetical protein
VWKPEGLTLLDERAEARGVAHAEVAPLHVELPPQALPPRVERRLDVLEELWQATNIYAGSDTQVGLVDPRCQTDKAISPSQSSPQRPVGSV